MADITNINIIKAVLGPNPITQSNITKITGIKGPRIRECVQKMRRMGVPIHSGNDGYEISAAKIGETIEHLEARAHSCQETADALRGLLQAKEER